jgi:glycosyltransferase involved in cell wall biosynthesis
MRVLMISTDQSLLQSGSAACRRHAWYAGAVDELHIIVLSTRGRGTAKDGGEGTKIAENAWVYPTRSFSRLFSVFDAVLIGTTIAKGLPRGTVLTCQDPFLTALAGWWISRKAKMALHIQVHTDFLSPHFRRLSLGNYIRYLLARCLVLKADGVRAVSLRIKRSLLNARPNVPFRYGQTKRYPLTASSITVLPVFTETLARTRETPSFDLRRKFPQFTAIVLMVCRLVPEKDVMLALRAFETVLPAHPAAGLVVVGSGPLLSALRRKAPQTSVAFEGFQDDLAPYYRGADVFLQTSRYEGYGRALVEAALHGLPFISTDVGVAPELAGPVAGAAICPVGDQHAIAVKLSALLSDSALRQTVSSTARSALPSLVISDTASYLAAWKQSLDLV